MVRLRSSGMTLIELLIAMTVTAILTGIVVMTLKTCLETYYVVQDNLFLQKLLDEKLHVIEQGDYNAYGIRDALEIVEAGTTSITFVPLWIDDTREMIEPSSHGVNRKFVLNRPFKPGSWLPVAEYQKIVNGKMRWKQGVITFFLDETRDPLKPNDKVSFIDTVPSGAKIRFKYYPDSTNFSDTAMTIKSKNDQILRIYRGQTENISRHKMPAATLEGLRFQYFTNMNKEIVPSTRTQMLSAEQILNVTAVRINLSVGIRGATKSGSAFINIRNARLSGAGIILSKGMKFRVPNSHDVRAFSLVNVMGVKKGGLIKLGLRSSEGQTWRVNVRLGIKDDMAIIEGYSIEYPVGQVVYALKGLDAHTDQPFSFLTVGSTGRYDYDLDENADDVVDLKGEVYLTVLEMDAAGAAVFVRP